MKKNTFIFIFLLLMLPLFGHSEYFHVEKYNVNVIINNDSSVYFEENILVNFHTYRHGIYRYIPIKLGKYKFRNKIILIESSLNGKNFSHEKYKIWEKNGWVYIRLGKKNKTIKGLKYYKIVYKIYNAIINNTFYWNVIGTGWKVPVKDANISVLFPEISNLSTLQHVAYKGRKGSTEKINYDISNNSMEINNISLKPREGITVKLIFPNGVIKPIPPFKKFIWFLIDYSAYFIPLVTLILLFLVWLNFGKDEKKGSIVVQYEPPEGYTPAELGTLIDDKVDKKDIAATIIDLAEKGYLKINKDKKQILFFKKNDFILEKLEQDTGNLKEHELILLNGLFPIGKITHLNDLRKDFHKTIKEFKESLFKYLANKEHLYTINPQKIRAILYGITGAFYLIGFLFGKFYFNYYYRKDLAFAFIISACITFLFTIIIPQKSHKGTNIYRKILGFKEFIDKVEKDRLERLLKEKPDIFNKILPFAIAFGIEKKWAKKFRDLNIHPPMWYTGYTSDNFSSDNFIDALQSDISSFTSSVGSASGSSGGGGGGGGGGSW